MSVETLGKKLATFRAESGMSLRDVEAATGISNPTLHRIEHGKAVDYDTGKKLEQYLADYVLPRQWKILYQPCNHQYGIVSSHVCKEWYVEGPPTGGQTVTVIEVRPHKKSNGHTDVVAERAQATERNPQ